jgi:hypothetical protein
MFDGFQFGRVAEPTAGVIEFEGVHCRAFLKLFEYADSEARRNGEFCRRNVIAGRIHFRVAWLKENRVPDLTRRTLSELSASPMLATMD